MSAVTRAVMKQIRQARGKRPSQYLSLGIPKYARPERARGLKSALGRVAGPLHGDERFWRNLNSIRLDSGAEKLLVRWLAMSGAHFATRIWVFRSVLDAAEVGGPATLRRILDWARQQG